MDDSAYGSWPFNLVGIRDAISSEDGRPSGEDIGTGRVRWRQNEC